MVSPNFFIAGAPKSGTSSMHDYLSRHPRICMSSLKEPIHFGRDLAVDSIWCIRDDERYQDLFRPGPAAVRIGESSTWYLYSQTAAAEIHAFNPDARIIAMLRHPVDAMYSLHGQFLFTGNEDIEDFEEALAAEPDRRSGRLIPESCVMPAALQYTQVFRYARQIERYFNQFGRDRVKAILFEDFVKDTPRIFRETLEFLGVDSTFTTTFEVVNPARAVSPGLSQFVARRPTLRKAIHALAPPSVQKFAFDAMQRFARKIDRPARIPPEVRARLLPEFAEEIGDLGQILGRDLSHWLR